MEPERHQQGRLAAGCDHQNLTMSLRLIAAMGARLLGEPIEDALPKVHLDALAKLAAPEIGP